MEALKIGSFFDELLNHETHPHTAAESGPSSIEGISNVSLSSSSSQSEYSLDNAAISAAYSSGSISTSILSPPVSDLRPQAVNFIPPNTTVTEIENNQFLNRFQALHPSSDESRWSSFLADYNLLDSYMVSRQSQSPPAFISHALNSNGTMNGTAGENSFGSNQNSQILLNSQVSAVRVSSNDDVYGHEISSYRGSNWPRLGGSQANMPRINAPMEANLGIRLSPISPEVKLCIYNLAKDRNGCCHLQQKIDEGDDNEISFIFYGIIDHLAELMENPSGNYLVQKMIGVCNDDQRIHIVFMLTKDPYVLIRVASNNHGTRPVQKLIAAIKTKFEAALIVRAILPGFLRLVKDVNGSHVIQSCLASLTAEFNRFIFDAAAQNCVDIAMDQYGCRVLLACVDCSSGNERTKLLLQISSNALDLARDPFGNYTVQAILDLQNPIANRNFMYQFKENYVDLSKQKFSSNVVEKCIIVFEDDDRAKLIMELLSSSEFKQLLQDPYANYVIKCALEQTKDSPLHSLIVQNIRPHARMLKACPYFKKINKLISTD